MNRSIARKIIRNGQRVDFNQNTSIKRDLLLNVYVVRYHANGYVQHFTNFLKAYSFAYGESLNRYVSL